MGISFLVRDAAAVDDVVQEALLREDGASTISNATLVAMTLMIAESRPNEKDVPVRIVNHLLCNEGPA